MSAPKLEPGQSLADCPATKEFRERHEQVARAAEEHAAQRQHAKGKGTARERIDQLLDNGSFLEVGQFSGSGVGANAKPSGVVTGFGTIDGRQVAVYSQDFSVQGGSLGSRRCGGAALLRTYLQPHLCCLRPSTPDQCHLGALRGWCGVLTGAYRLCDRYPPGLPHVRHRP